MLEANKVLSLEYAIKKGDKIAVIEAINSGANVNSPIGPHASSLEYALECCPRVGEEYNIKRNLLPMWRELVLAGADVNQRIGNNYTLLHKAVQYGLFDFAKFLLERGADCNAVDAERKSPLYYSIVAHLTDYDIMELLLENGANIPDVFETDWPVAHIAVTAHSKIREISDVDRLVDFLSTADVELRRAIMDVFNNQSGKYYLALLNSGRDVNKVLMGYRANITQCERDYRDFLNSHEYANPLIAFLNKHKRILSQEYVDESHGFLNSGSRNSVHLTPQIKQLDEYLDSLYVESYRAVEQAYRPVEQAYRAVEQAALRL